ncbi:hypothetical protein OUZ56_004296 [Daphnia magna]|uniref:Uncharacterized protein n=1 Tax=Daphnia magna TaxID=35525 RepID=A0ABQ9YPH5_9CRUS|nr:hypothetical protein OUZ56_004296 [Daphnia magna]
MMSDADGCTSLKRSKEDENKLTFDFRLMNVPSSQQLKPPYRSADLIVRFKSALDFLEMSDTTPTFVPIVLEASQQQEKCREDSHSFFLFLINVLLYI